MYTFVLKTESSQQLLASTRGTPISRRFIMLCACGCGKETELYTDTHSERGVFKGQPRKYYTGHNKNTVYNKQLDMPVVPRLCACGCGQETPIAKYSDKRTGNTKGLPCKYVEGHNRLAGPNKEPLSPCIPKTCECGCGQETKIATYTCNRLGIIKGQHLRFVRGHGHKKELPEPQYCACGCGQITNYQRRTPSRFIEGHNRRRPDADKFWEKVAVGAPDECWEWKAGKDVSGYGTFSINGRTQHASRAAWIITHGSIPEGLHILHSCNNPGCVNPAHLRPGTDKENVDDCIRAGRKVDPPVYYGKQNNRSKITDEQVQQIRSLFAQGNITRKQLAEQFGVSRATIERIILGIARTHAFIEQ